MIGSNHFLNHPAEVKVVAVVAVVAVVVVDDEGAMAGGRGKLWIKK